MKGKIFSTFSVKKKSNSPGSIFILEDSESGGKKNAMYFMKELEIRRLQNERLGRQGGFLRAGGPRRGRKFESKPLSSGLIIRFRGIPPGRKIALMKIELEF